MVRRLRRVSVVEATSYLVLVAAAIVKRTSGAELGVTVMGPIHGILFLVYAGLLLRDHQALGWTLWKTVTAMVLGSLPFGGFWVEHQWLAPLDDTASCWGSRAGSEGHSRST